MKFIKIIFYAIGILFFSIFLLGAAYWISLPGEPEVIYAMESELEDVNQIFHEIDPSFWKKEGDQLIFLNNSEKKQKATLFTNQLPSERKKKGYITTSVKVPIDFKNMDKQAIIGLQIGEKMALERDHLIIGINGLGALVALDGDLRPLEGEQVKIRGGIDLSCQEVLKFSFHYYRNPYGWILYFKAIGENGTPCTTSAMINHIPSEKLDDSSKAISLVAYNPSGMGELSFLDWQILNDWTPND